MSNADAKTNKKAPPRRWYCLVQGRQVGPLTDGQLRELGHTGRLVRSDKVRKGSEGKWVAAERVRGLFPEDASPADAVNAERHGQPPKAASPASTTVIPRNPSGDAARGPNSNRQAGRFSAKWLLIGGGAMASLLLLGLVAWLFVFAGDSSMVAEAPATQPSGDSFAPVAENDDAEAPSSEAIDSPSGTESRSDDDAKEDAASLENSTAPAADSSTPVEVDAEVTPPIVPLADPGPIDEQASGRPDGTAAESTASATSATAESDAASSSSPSKSSERDTEVAETEHSHPDGVALEPTESEPSDVTASHQRREARVEQEREWTGKQLASLDRMFQQYQEGVTEFRDLGVRLAKKQQEAAKHSERVAMAKDQLPRLEKEYLRNKDELFEIRTNPNYGKRIIPQGNGRGKIEIGPTQVQIQAEKRRLETRQRQIEAEATQHNKNLKDAKVAEPNLLADFDQLRNDKKALLDKARQLHLEWMQELDPYGLYPKSYRIELLEHSKDWPDAFIYGILIRGFAQVREGQPREAKEALSQLIEKLDHVIEQEKVAKRQESSGRDQNAEQIVPELEVLQAAFAGRGFAKHHLGEDQDALRDLNQAIALNKQKPLPYVLRGIVRSSGRADGAALDDFENATRRNKDYAAGYREAARLRLASTAVGNLQRALKQAETARELTADEDWSALAVYAQALAAVGQVAEAREFYVKAIELAPIDRLDELEAALAKLSADK